MDLPVPPQNASQEYVVDLLAPALVPGVPRKVVEALVSWLVKDSILIERDGHVDAPRRAGATLRVPDEARALLSGVIIEAVGRRPKVGSIVLALMGRTGRGAAWSNYLRLPVGYGIPDLELPMKDPVPSGIMEPPRSRTTYVSNLQRVVWERVGYVKAFGAHSEPEGEKLVDYVIERATDVLERIAQDEKAQRPLGVQGLQMSSQVTDGSTVVPTTDENDASTGSEQIKERPVFCQDGEVWLVEFAGTKTRLKYRQGFEYVRRLLAKPHQDVPVEDLEGTQVSSTNDHVVDGEALAKLRSERDYYRQALRDATDPEERSIIQEQLDQIKEFIAKSTNERGLPRTTCDEKEKVRGRVRAALASALKAIAKEHRELGEHLKKHIRNPNGVAPRYAPPEGLVWETEC